MAGMTNEHRDALLELLTSYEELLTENQALKAILETIRLHGPFTESTWQEQLQTTMSSPAREAYRSAFAPILEKINSAFQDSELYRRLLKIPIKGAHNIGCFELSSDVIS